MASRPTGIVASSSSGAPASGAPAPNPVAQRAAEVRAAMARVQAPAPARRLAQGPPAAGAPPVNNAQAGRDYNPLQGGLKKRRKTRKGKSRRRRYSRRR